MTKKKTAPRGQFKQTGLAAQESTGKSRWLIIAGIILIAAGFFVFRKPAKQTQLPASNEIISNQSLPSGWKITDQDTNGVALKIEKTTGETIKPTIVVIGSKTEETDSKAYVDKLLKGLRSAIPSLKVESDTEKVVDNIYRRDFSYSYYAGKDKIAVRQRVVIENGETTTLTASYSAATKDENLKQEIEAIFGNID